MLWELLLAFIFRICLGVALAMAWTSPRDVASGFFRVHLWVVMGLNTLAALVAGTQSATPIMLLSILAALASYLGAVVWLYEARRPGLVLLYLVAALNFLAAAGLGSLPDSVAAWLMRAADILTGGLLLGLTLSAMFLGHWYLTTPSMKLRPLQKLIAGILLAAALRGLLCGAGLWWHTATDGWPSNLSWALIGLRWGAGLLGVAGLAWMTRQTLKIPNTQSATGILYVAVIFCFLGELSSQMLSSGTRFPI